MKCCVKCFNDTEIKAIIESFKIKGNCDFCEGQDVYTYDLETDNTIVDLFDGLLDIYSAESSLPDDYPKEHLDLLKNILTSKWNIFTERPNRVYKLIIHICSKKYNEQPELFSSNVGIKEAFDQDYLEKYSVIRRYHWNNFVTAIKKQNRFHTDYINKEVLSLFLKSVEKTYEKGTIFYRARMCSNETGIDTSQMGAPPATKATAGRANSEGISCLYLADSQKTTIHEIRAGIYDYITIGKFVLLQDIIVINLADIDKISPFSEMDYTQYAVNMEHLKMIRNELAKPLRRYDSALDYLPTQYISDYIKSQMYDGIEYISIMCKEGFNLAIFNEELFRCTDTTVFDIKDLEYTYKQTVRQ